MEHGSRRNRRPKLKQKFNSLITNAGGLELGNFELEGHLLMQETENMEALNSMYTNIEDERVYRFS